MSEGTARLDLPLIDTSQAQKEVTHNEALLALDLLVQASVVATGLNTPPIAPTPGQAWGVGDAPTGAWTGHAGAIAGWTTGGWRFAAASDGMEAWSQADGCAVRFTGGGWDVGTLRGTALLIDGTPVIGAQQSAIADPAGGATADAEARAAIAAILNALRDHGLIAA